MAVKASDRVKYYENPNGPVIGTVNRNVIEKDGLYFKDLDGSGEWKIYDDWRIPAKERAEAYVKELTLEEKIAQLFISDWRKGKYPAGGSVETLSEEKVLDVIFGRFAPVGKLPIILPRGEAVLAVNAEGICMSPNDVPGYDKDLYMPESMKDENGKAYAYRDCAGN